MRKFPVIDLFAVIVSIEVRIDPRLRASDEQFRAARWSSGAWPGWSRPRP